MLLRGAGVALPRRLSALLEVESGLNDPMSIFLTILLIRIITEPGWLTLGHAVVLFTEEMVGGAVLGLAGGWLLAQALRRLPLDAPLGIVLALTGALALFGFAQLLGASGFLAIYLAGVVTDAASPQRRQDLERFFDGMAWLAQIVLFLMLGLLVTPHDLPQFIPYAIVAAAVLIFVARPVSVFACLLPFRFSFRESVFASWVGLRGAVPIYLSFLPAIADPTRDLAFFAGIFMLVVASLVVAGLDDRAGRAVAGIRWGESGRCRVTKARCRIRGDDAAGWRKWGPYLSDRQWGTVREDYSENGDAWGYFSHDQARSRAYRWGEDGIAGISDDRQILCFALTLWNGADPILKERYFGLTNNEGNHGEDVKEYYFYLDNTPTHSFMRMLYKYPQRAFPYEQLVRENRRRSRAEPEFELLDTGVFADDRYFDVEVLYAKAAPEDILIEITASNRGDQPATLHLLPTLWFRNTWAWGDGSARPVLRRRGIRRSLRRIRSLGSACLSATATCRCCSPKMIATTGACSVSRTRPPS